MRHKHGYRSLGRDSAHRKATLRNMTTSLVLHERINTTLQKAKEIRRIVDKMVTLGKRGDLHARRQAAEYLFDDAATAKVFSDLATRFKDRNGGYTRILKRGPRAGDSAEQAIIEFVDFTFGETEKTQEKSEKDSKKA